MTGTVKFFNDSKGYGFITNEETGKDIFVHVSNLNGMELREGDQVSEYTEEEGTKGHDRYQYRNALKDFFLKQKPQRLLRLFLCA
jgi:CspA family cold shock protein